MSSDAGKGPEIRKGFNHTAYWEGFDRINFSGGRKKKELESPVQIDIINEDDYEVCDTRQQPGDSR